MHRNIHAKYKMTSIIKLFDGNYVQMVPPYYNCIYLQHN